MSRTAPWIPGERSRRKLDSAWESQREEGKGGGKGPGHVRVCAAGHSSGVLGHISGAPGHSSDVPGHSSGVPGRSSGIPGPAEELGAEGEGEQGRTGGVPGPEAEQGFGPAEAHPRAAGGGSPTARQRLRRSSGTLHGTLPATPWGAP